MIPGQSRAREESIRPNVIAYGHTQHSFTNPGVDLPEMGAVYDEKAARRSWQALASFLHEIFKADA